MQYFITSAPAAGFNFVFRATWSWPKDGLLVEVLDQEDDIPRAKQPEGGPRCIGRKTWEALKADTRIFARPAGDIEDIAAASVALVDARAKIAALEQKIVELETKIIELTAALETATAPPAPSPAPPAPASEPEISGGGRRKGKGGGE